jgi:O-antigen ligase
MCENESCQRGLPLLKLILYASLMVIGIIAALFSPISGAVAAVESYLLNPTAISMETGGLHFQQYVTIAFMIGVAFRIGGGLPHKGREGLVVACLWVFMVIAAVVSVLFAVISTKQALDALYELFKTFIVATLFLWAVRTKQHLRILMIACVVGVLHAAALHVLGSRLGFVSSQFTREYGVLPDSQAAVMVLFIPLLIAVAGTGKPWERILAFCTLPLAIDSIVNTFQRTGFVSLAAEALLLMLLGPRVILKRLVPVLLIGAALFVFRFTTVDYWQWISTIQDPTQGSANARLVVNKASVRMFFDHPMGVGYRNYPDVSPRYLPENLLSEGRRSAHNIYFSILCETGIFGFAAWMGAIIGSLFLLRKVRKAAKGDDMTFVSYALALEIGLYGWLVDGFFQGDQEADPAYWFMVLAVVMTRIYHQQVSQQQAPAAPAVPSQGSNPYRNGVWAGTRPRVAKLQVQRDPASD